MTQGRKALAALGTALGCALAAAAWPIAVAAQASAQTSAQPSAQPSAPAGPLVVSPLVQGPWRLVAPFPPGGPVDSLARLLATGLQDRHSGSAVVDNKPGAAGNLGIEAVKRAAIFAA